MRAHRSLRSILMFTLLLACDGDDDGGIGDDDTCEIFASLSGDVASELPGDDGVACLSQFSGGDVSDIDVDYILLDDPDLVVSLEVRDVPRGVPTTGLTATVRVSDSASDKVWQSNACTVDITEHDSRGPVELGEGFRARGTGSCLAPLTDDAGGSVTLGTFEFVVVITWTG